MKDINGIPHAWVRDNVYSISVVWALALAYKKIMDGSRDLAIIYLLEQSAVKCMRGLMKAMMGQIDKVEKFKTTFSRKVHIPGVPKC